MIDDALTYLARLALSLIGLALTMVATYLAFMWMMTWLLHLAATAGPHN